MDGLVVADVRVELAGQFPYAVATAAGAISPYITLVICGLVAAFYALPGTTRGTPEDAPSAASSP